MDDKDFVFIQKTLDEKEEKEFSDFLKNRKLLKKHSRKHKNKTTVKTV